MGEFEKSELGESEKWNLENFQMRALGIGKRQFGVSEEGNLEDLGKEILENFSKGIQRICRKRNWRI